MDLETLSSNSRFSTTHSMSKSRFRHTNSQSPFRSPKGSRFSISSFTSPSGFNESEEEKDINDDFDISLASSNPQVSTMAKGRAKRGKKSNDDSESINSVISGQNYEEALASLDNRGEDVGIVFVPKKTVAEEGEEEDEIVSKSGGAGLKTEGEEIADYEHEDDDDDAYADMVVAMDEQKKELDRVSRKLEEARAEITRLKAENAKLRSRLLKPSTSKQFPSARIGSIVGAKTVGVSVVDLARDKTLVHSRESLEAMSIRQLMYLAQRLNMEVKASHKKYLAKSLPPGADTFKKNLIKYILDKSGKKRKSSNENPDDFGSGNDLKDDGENNKRPKRDDDDKDEGGRKGVSV
jgi:hypothetical protein